MDAARAGLRLAFGDELLWRDLLRAAHQTGQEELLRAVVEEICARTALDEVLPRMAPETESLIDDLYPSWRTTVPYTPVRGHAATSRSRPLPPTPTPAHRTGNPLWWTTRASRAADNATSPSWSDSVAEGT